MTDDNPFAIEESPGTALAKVDDLKAEFVFIPGNMDALLIDIREQALAKVAGLNISTPKMRKQIKDTANKVVKSRTFIERLRVGYVSAEKKRLATVDAEAKRIKEILQGIEDEVRQPLTQWESAEDARVQAHNDALSELRNTGPYTQANWMNLSVEAMADRLREVEEDARDWQEFAVPAQHEKAEAVKLIEEAIAKRETYDREQAELAKLRADASAREQQERIDAAAQIAREHAEQEAKEAIARAENERYAAEKRAKDAEAKAEADRLDAIERERIREEKYAADREAAVEAERKRNADAAAREYREMEARAADDKHREAFNLQAIDALRVHCEIPIDLADAIVRTISNGLIPHVKIEY